MKKRSVALIFIWKIPTSSKIYFLTNMKQYLFVFIICILMGCKSNSKDIIPVFNVEKQLHAEMIGIDELIAPDFITQKEDYLFIASGRADTMIQIYSLPDLTHIKGMGLRGRGPNEFYAFPMFCNSSEKNILYLWGYKPQLIRKGDISLGDIKFSKDILIKSGDTLNDMYILKDSILIYYLPAELIIKKYDIINEKELDRISFKKDSHGQSSYYSNRGALAMNDSLLIYAYFYKKQIDIYDVNTFKLLCSIRDNKRDPLPIPGTDLGDYQYQYVNVLIGENYFYAVSPKGIARETSEHGLYLEVFSHDGRPVIKYSFDISPPRIVVDEKNKYIYGYNYQYLNSLLRFSLDGAS